MPGRSGDPEHTEADASAVRALADFAARVGPGLPRITNELDQAAVEALDALEAAGVGALLLKGPALARLLYRPTEQRWYFDVDLLVAPGDLQAARDVLTALGYRNVSATLGIDDVGGVVHEECWVGRPSGEGNEILIELHRRLAGAAAPALQAWEALSARSTAMELGGRSVPILDRNGAAMHVAMHAAQHGLQYERGRRELELALQRWAPEVWEKAAILAAEIGATATFAAGLRLVPAGEALAERLALPDTSRLDWEIRQASRPRGTFHVEALAGARGVRARASVLRRALVPGPVWMRRQYTWARTGSARLVAAYALHVLRAPFWAARAAWFRHRARVAGDAGATGGAAHPRP